MRHTGSPSSADSSPGRALAIVACSSLLVIAACSAAGNTASTEGTGGAGGGSSGSGQGGDTFVGATTGSGTFGGKNCGSTTYGNQVPGSVLVVLDRSGSMSGGNGEPDKWGPTKSALSSMMASANPDLRMGLFPFPAGKFDDSALALCALNPSSPQCAPLFADGGCLDVYASPVVPVGPLSSTQSAINSWLASNGPKGNTPTYSALKTAYGIMQAIQAEGERFVLLMTDGEPTTHTPPMNLGGIMFPESNIECKELPDIEQLALDASNGTPEIKTFVIGAPGSEGAGEFLSQLALNGKTARSPSCSAAAKDCHYQIGQINFQMELEAVLKQIAGMVTDCVFKIPQGNDMVDPTLVNVVVETSNGTIETAQDASRQDGWDYINDAKNTVQLFGPACDAYKAEKGAKVQIILGCKTVVK